jgi:DNA-binding MarR family transcriptional regulator
MGPSSRGDLGFGRKPDKLLTMTIDVVNNNMTTYDAVLRPDLESIRAFTRVFDALWREGANMSDRQLAQNGGRQAGPPAAPGKSDLLRRKPLDIGVLNGHLGYFIRRLQVWVFQDFIRTLAPVDIRPAQYSVLVVIAANPGLSQSDLADLLGIERARLVRLLDKLERRGLTQRLSSRTDRRSHALRLTPDGQKTLKRAKMLAALHEARLVEKLGADQRRSMIDVMRTFER